MKKIVLFASGAGSNVENIIHYFKNNATVSIEGVFSNNPEAKVLEKASHHNIHTFLFQRNDLTDGTVATMINTIKPDLIVLSGFLLKFPASIISEYPNKIINIHPALLPKYGGKGMYGIKVHQAILDQHETTSGITIHYVTEHYDEGKFIFQKAINIENCITAEAIAEKIHQLEYEHFPKEIEKLLTAKS
jgi:phosphoribosylglycinamide formyltransferase-1